jgi:hypothetical protein
VKNLSICSKTLSNPVSTPVTKRDKPITVPEGTVIQVVVPVFPLHDGDFLRLTKVRSFTSIWAHSFFAGTGVWGVTLLAKFVDHKYFNGSGAVTHLEWVTLSILVILVVFFEALHLMLPSEKKKILKKIRAHFKTS